MSKPVVSWAGPALAAEKAIREGSEEAETHKAGARERAIAKFQIAEEQCRLARYFLEDEKMAELVMQTKRNLAGGE